MILNPINVIINITTNVNNTTLYPTNFANLDVIIDHNNAKCYLRRIRLNLAINLYFMYFIIAINPL